MAALAKPDRDLMEPLIARITEATGLDAAVIQKAIGLILAFLVKEGPQEEVSRLIDVMPGAQQAIAVAGDGGPGEGGGGFMGMGGGGGVMALGGKLMGLGISMSQMQVLARELFAWGRETAGEDVMGAIVGGVPGLGQFV
jgi:hypothetical protein